MVVYHRAAWALLGWLALMPSLSEAQGSDSTQHALRDLIEGLPPSARVRLGSAGERWEGRITDRDSDSVVVLGEAGPRTFDIPAIDTLWLRGEKHDGLLAGVGFGAVMFSLLLISRGKEERAMNVRLGTILLLGSATAGLLVDAVSERWTQWYPE